MVVAAPDLPAIEVVYALPDRQRVVGLALTDGLTALGAVTRSGLLEEFPELDAACLTLGIWGRRVGANERLHAGDRVEIYRSLRFDPRAARREAAQVSDRGPRKAKAKAKTKTKAQRG